jgi:hypothetical protein
MSTDPAKVPPRDRPQAGRRTGLKALVLWPLAGALGWASVDARALETWIMPYSFQASPGQPVATSLSDGNGLTPLSAPHRAGLRALQLVDVSGRFDPERWDRRHRLAQARFRAAAPGVACLVLSTDESEIRISPEAVEDYLDEIQAPGAVLKAWGQQRARREPWVERYTKEAKTYLRTGTTQAGWPALAQIGHRLELVPQTDPTRLQAGQWLSLVLMHDGKPQGDTALRLFTGSSVDQATRTDAQGLARFRLDKPGPHLVTATVLIAPAAAADPWTSHFATLGFGVGR